MRRILALALLALALAGPAGAQPPGGPPGPLEVIRARATELGIDPATVARLGAIAEAAQPERQRLAAAVLEARAGLDVLLQAETPDRKAILAQVDRLGAAETAQMRHGLGILLDLRAELTPAQRAAVEALMRTPPPGAPPLPPPGMAPPGMAPPGMTPPGMAPPGMAPPGI